jgi:hypothetical protein
MMSSKKLVALFAVVWAALVTAVPFLDAADARLPCPCPGQGSKHHQKTKSLIGKYKGATEEGGTVSFTFTRDRKIVDFTLTNATLYCVTEYSSKIPTREPEYKKPLAAIAHDGPIPMRGVSKRFPQGKEFSFAEPSPAGAARQSGLFTGKVEDLLATTPAGAVVQPEKGFIGEVEFETANGPTPYPSSQNPIPVWAPGTEWCVTKPIDWKAKKPGDPGFVP